MGVSNRPAPARGETLVFDRIQNDEAEDVDSVEYLLLKMPISPQNIDSSACLGLPDKIGVSLPPKNMSGLFLKTS